MTTDRDELMALIKRQPPMSAERFEQQVEKARRLSPNVEAVLVDSETNSKKTHLVEKKSQHDPEMLLSDLRGGVNWGMRRR